MKSKEITVTVSRLIATDSYENCQIQISETIELGENDKCEKVRQKKLEELMQVMVEKDKEIRKAFKKSKK